MILTTSDTHDPKVTPMAPKSLDPQTLAHPVKGGFGAGMRAYTSSKLCNIMTALSLARSTELAGRGVTVIAFNPGFTLGTNLGGRGPVARRVAPLIIRPIFGVVSHFKPEYSAGTPERAGEVLAELATGALTPPADRSYVSIVNGQVAYPEPSELARDTAARERLWDQSARMVGLPAT
jgi:NAD(P)-dependent dehydrogenase (short-subunit alcohol dehydrogenase family)